ncbi:hypothetical protein ATY81_16380 [Rhizobium sp. R72]|nr:hypothetical protein ATY81_16380 [Rhizobium sp. R72]OWV92945.1 hypothetical protein ATY80_16380 [Rhizobium sp. R711]
MAAFALDNVYPASDTMITSRTKMSILLSAIRYILPISQVLQPKRRHFNCAAALLNDSRPL